MKTKRMLITVITVVAAIGLVISAAAPVWASDADHAQAVIDKARITFNDFMQDKNFTWLHENIKNAKGLLIFPEVLKAGFIVGGSGGTGVLVVRDEKDCNWSQPVFYTIGSVSFGLQAGGQSAEVIMMVMNQHAIDSLYASSLKLGGDASVALGPIGEGAKSTITASFISFAKAKGLYAGIDLEGSVLHVRDGLNAAYYGKDVKPVDILVKKDVSNEGSQDFLATLSRQAWPEGRCTS